MNVENDVVDQRVEIMNAIIMWQDYSVDNLQQHT
jgi:hypothetical protein